MTATLPETLPDEEKTNAKKILLAIGSAIIFKKKFYFTSYVPRGLSCVEAAIDRGNWLVQNLPSQWWIDVYTWKSNLHTANLVYFKGSDGLFHCWMVDGYGYPVTQNAVEYIKSQENQPNNSFDDGRYTRQMAEFPRIKGVFPARGRSGGNFS